MTVSLSLSDFPCYIILLHLIVSTMERNMLCCTYLNKCISTCSCLVSIFKAIKGFEVLIANNFTCVSTNILTAVPPSFLTHTV